MKFKINDKVFNIELGTFIIRYIYEPFNGLVEINEPLLLICDNNIDKETYVSYKEYKELKYYYVKNINIIERGFFKRKIKLSEEHERYDIENINTNEIIKGCYLHNGSWTYCN